MLWYWVKLQIHYCDKCVQWVYYNFPNTFNWYLTTQTQKMAQFFSTNFLELLHVSFSSFWERPLWIQKLLLLTATVQRFCYAIVKPFPTLSCFPFFNQTFLELIFASNIKTNFLKQLFCLQVVKKILRILCVWTLQILFINKLILF